MLSFTVSTLRIARAPKVSRVSAAQSCGCPVEGVGGGVQEFELAVVERGPFNGVRPRGADDARHQQRGSVDPAQAREHGGDREHGVTVVPTSFQIAGCVGTSLAAGVYGALNASGTARNRAPWGS